MTMMMLPLLRSLTTIIIATASVGHAFAPLASRRLRLKPLHAVSYTYSDVADVGYAISVAKPLGIVFGENADPFYGLVVDDVEAGMNGGAAGMRVGDQLLAVNGKSFVGASFDTVMSELVAAEGNLELQMYRGNVRSLYVILLNQKATFEPEAQAETTADDEGVIVMDESYESPVRIDLSQFEDKPLTPGDVLKAFKKIGSILTEGDGAPADAPKEEVKPKGGFFGLFGGGDTKQDDFFLDENDSNSLGGRGGARK
jgi:PDZ domain